jgi:hypothetical protein
MSIVDVSEKLKAYALQLGLLPVCTIHEKTFRAQLPRLQSHGGLVVERWLQRLLQSVGFTFDDELDNKSVTSPEALFDALGRYFTPDHWGVDRQKFEYAVGYAYRVFGHDKGDKLSPLPLDESLLETIQLSKASGSPEFLSKGEAFTKDLERAGKICERKTRRPYCMPFRRCQHGKRGPKTRLVWGYPLSMTLLEARFARPLINCFLANPRVMAFGGTNAGAGARITGIENMGTRVSLDFSGFDATVSDHLIDVAFNILSTHFVSFDEEEKRAWSTVRGYFTRTPIAMPDGNMYVKRRGIPSGSYFTQLVDSIVNFIAVQYAFLRAHDISIHQEKMLVLGDDCVLGCPVEPDVNALVRAFSEMGLQLNQDKTEVSREGSPVSFLGHTWNRGIKYRPVVELVKRAVYPEKHSSQSGVEGIDRLYSIGGSAENGELLLLRYYQALHGNMAPGPKSMVYALFTPALATGQDELREALEPSVLPGGVNTGFSGPEVIALGPLR